MTMVERKAFANGDVCPEAGIYRCKSHDQIIRNMKEGEIFPECGAWGHNVGTYKEPRNVTVWINWNPNDDQKLIDEAYDRKYWNR